MKRLPPVYTWQKIDAQMPSGEALEIKRANGVTELGVRLPMLWLMDNEILIAALLRRGEITDAVAWRNVPGHEPLPTDSEIHIEELVAA